MRLSLEEKKYLYKVLDRLTDATGDYHASAHERQYLAYPLYKKFKMELLGK